MARRLVLRCALIVVCMWLTRGEAARAASADKGRDVYANRCAFCHGAGGKGDGPAAAALKPPPTNFAAVDFWKRVNPETIKGVIQNGKPGTAMVAFKASLNDEQIDDLIAYLRTFSPQP